jgi:hypothetical protein
LSARLLQFVGDDHTRAPAIGRSQQLTEKRMAAKRSRLACTEHVDDDAFLIDCARR